MRLTFSSLFFGLFMIQVAYAEVALYIPNFDKQAFIAENVGSSGDQTTWRIAPKSNAAATATLISGPDSAHLTYENANPTAHFVVKNDCAIAGGTATCSITQSAAGSESTGVITEPVQQYKEGGSRALGVPVGSVCTILAIISALFYVV